METIKVNMSPNPLDVQTIHASQNDGEARQWEFELHNNGELIDTSEVTEQMFFKAYKGGTEEILPTNGSVPTTAPFLGDIRYPQGLLTDQEFTYRQSPTEEDGLAKITDIKGNTLVWNQLVDASTSSVNLTNGHKFVTKVSGSYSLVSGTGQSLSVTGGTDEVFDLTKMFGSYNEPTTLAQFTSLFPLSYYDYNAGTLLSFNGNGIKTVGKNLASGISQGAVDIHGGTTSNEKRLRVDGFVRVFQGDRYTFTATSNSGKTLQIYTRYFADANGSEQVSYLDWLNLPRSVIIPSGVNYATFTIRFGNNDNITVNDVSDVQIEHGAPATSYEPYESHTTNLPIATYFPTGMKSAGDVYDELTETKAITRVGSRAYQSGDESDTSVITDGTTTYYALSTPTETSFTTASLVTENAEIPLSNEDGVLIGKCTEELSDNPGFIDAKIKLSDGDGECYSNKIQLHVERSPQ